MLHDVWVEVDLSALKHNLRQIHTLTQGKQQIIAVVKANGYGHGYVEPAKAFLDAGASALAVTRLEEALILREGGVDAPILLFAPIQPENASDAIKAGIQLTVASESLILAISKAAQALHKTAKVHIKVDTGMGRLGLQPNEVVLFANKIISTPNVDIAGIYTHFATAAETDLTAAKKQNTLFASTLQSLSATGISHGLAHAANSASIIRMPDSHYDAIRPGTILYGQYPSHHVPRQLDLRNTWKLKARVCEVRKLPKGSKIGYGAEFTTTRETKVAVIPIGFADGFTLTIEGPVYRQSMLRFAVRRMKRSLSLRINGQPVPVLGRVGMQMTVVDVTDIPSVEVGTEVDIPAMRIPTNPLIPRIYIK